MPLVEELQATLSYFNSPASQRFFGASPQTLRLRLRDATPPMSSTQFSTSVGSSQASRVADTTSPHDVSDLALGCLCQPRSDETASPASHRPVGASPQMLRLRMRDATPGVLYSLASGSAPTLSETARTAAKHRNEARKLWRCETAEVAVREATTRNAFRRLWLRWKHSHSSAFRLMTTAYTFLYESKLALGWCRWDVLATARRQGTRMLQHAARSHRHARLRHALALLSAACEWQHLQHRNCPRLRLKSNAFLCLAAACEARNERRRHLTSIRDRRRRVALTAWRDASTIRHNALQALRLLLRRVSRLVRRKAISTWREHAGGRGHAMRLLRFGGAAFVRSGLRTRRTACS